MPELPEVETVRRGLAPVMEGARIDRVEQRRGDLRFPFPADFAERLDGPADHRARPAGEISARRSRRRQVLVSHLGMSGSFRIEAGGRRRPRPAACSITPRAQDDAHDHVVFHLDGPAARRRVIYNDPRRFGYMDLIARARARQPSAGSRPRRRADRQRLRRR